MAAKKDNQNKSSSPGLIGPVTTQLISKQLLREVDEIEKFAKMDARDLDETLSNIEELLKDARDKFSSKEYSKGLMAIFLVGQFSGPPGGYSKVLEGLGPEIRRRNLDLGKDRQQALKEVAWAIARHYWKMESDQQIRIGEMAQRVLNEFEPTLEVGLKKWIADFDKYPSFDALKKAKIPKHSTMKNWLREIPRPKYSKIRGRLK